MLPTHISIIMDGNGRWAAKHGRERLFGHNNGVQSVRDCCEAAVEMGIRYLSLYAFSEENWNRPQKEVEGLMSLMMKSVLEERPTFEKNNIRFRVVGNRSRLSPELVAKIEEVEAETASYDRLDLIIMLSYSGKWDILQAARRCIEENDGTPLTAEAFEKRLATAGIPDPDLLIRTSGEQRLSNYMLWQCAYTEFYYTDVLWPDFRKEDFRRAIEAFEKRNRRYGEII